MIAILLNSFVGEESTADKKEKPVLTNKPTWIIDPIDGTINYINHYPCTCISVGLAICKELVAGIIYNPLSSELYTAIKGYGAFLNDKPIKTSSTTGNQFLSKQMSRTSYKIK